MKAKIYADELWPVYEVYLPENRETRDYNELDFAEEVDVDSVILRRYIGAYQSFLAAREELGRYLEQTDNDPTS